MRTLIIYKSIHQGSTKILAQTMGKVLDADVIDLKDFDYHALTSYDLIGFGSGIYDNRFHRSITKFLETLPSLNEKKVFIFSTAGIIYEKSHKEIKALLERKHAVLVDEFYCRGLNAYSATLEHRDRKYLNRRTAYLNTMP
jgi:flavodoxin